jgi:hypothetical protein
MAVYPRRSEEQHRNGITRIGRAGSQSRLVLSGLPREIIRLPVRLMFADEFPEEKGDNCLLTKGFGFID